jgi:hypothetical protein
MHFVLVHIIELLFLDKAKISGLKMTVINKVAVLVISDIVISFLKIFNMDQMKQIHI